MSVLLQVETANEALPLAVDYVLENGYFEASRNGGAHVMPSTLVSDYVSPQFRVLFDPGRDANPFFHLFEAMWMLAGRNDLEFVEAFASNMKNFSVDGKTLQAAYGHRWRQVWGDQLAAVVRKLVKSPNSRQVVLNIWNPDTDLEDTPENAKDRACNISVVFTPRPNYGAERQLLGYTLDMTVYNRSNDLVWGAYGANYVHFGFLHEFVAAAALMRQGVYTQIGANSHLYTQELYGPRLYDALTSREATKMAVHNTAFNFASSTPPRLSAHNLYVADHPARALNLWGWSPAAHVHASNPVMWPDVNGNYTVSEEEEENSYHGPSFRTDNADACLKSLEPLNRMLDSMLETRKAYSQPSARFYDYLPDFVLVAESAEHEIVDATSDWMSSMQDLPLFVRLVVIPMFIAHEQRRRNQVEEAAKTLIAANRRVCEFAKTRGLPLFCLSDRLGGFHGVDKNLTGLSLDWFIAGYQWMERRSEIALPIGKTCPCVAPDAVSTSSNEWNA